MNPKFTKSDFEIPNPKPPNCHCSTRSSTLRNQTPMTRLQFQRRHTTEEMDSQRLKLNEKGDRITNLPDSIIHRILSFLPSTKEAIQTSVLSKRWQKQWTHVPVLIFDFSGTSSYIPTFIDDALMFHDCSKIKKFEIKATQDFKVDPNFNAKLRFAIRKEVEELILNIDAPEKFKLPNFFFNNASLVKLMISNCVSMPNPRVNWDCLKDLHIKFCTWPNQAIDRVVSGSPLLESLEITCCYGFDRLVIVSKSLKILVLADPYDDFSLEVSCPNLKEFHAVACAFNYFSLSSGAIENVLSGSPFLELLELVHYQEIGELVIDSKSLTKLILLETPIDAIIISCPKLEELNLTSPNTNRITLMNLPSSICATLDFDYCGDKDKVSYGKTLVRMILEQLQDVKELHFGRYSIQILSVLELRGLSSPSANSKSLTLDGGPNFVKNLPGISYALRSSPELEKLVINLQLIEFGRPKDLRVLNVSGENFWNSKETVFNCLVSHLKLVKITGLSKTKGKLNLVFNFIEFLLKNARVLEKMVVISYDGRADFLFGVSQKLLSFPRFSQRATIELLRS